MWKHGELLDAFEVGYKTKAYQVRTCKEWDDLLREKTLNEASCAQVSPRNTLHVEALLYCNGFDVLRRCFLDHRDIAG